MRNDAECTVRLCGIISAKDGSRRETCCAGVICAWARESTHNTSEFRAARRQFRVAVSPSLILAHVLLCSSGFWAPATVVKVGPRYIDLQFAPEHLRRRSTQTASSEGWNLTTRQTSSAWACCTIGRTAVPSRRAT